MFFENREEFFENELLFLKPPRAMKPENMFSWTATGRAKTGSVKLLHRKIRKFQSVKIRQAAYIVKIPRK